MMSQPNVIVIMVDQMKATASHLYGNSFCRTPVLERLANSGVLYEQAHTPHPLCAPARMALWTALYPDRSGLRENHQTIPPAQPHAFREWKKAGYRTGLIGKNHCFDLKQDADMFDIICEIGHLGLSEDTVLKGAEWVRPQEGIWRSHEVRRNMPVQSPVMSYAVTDYPLEDYSTSLVAAQTVRFLEDHQEEPFALWVSFPDPHTPLEVPRVYADKYTKEQIVLPPWGQDHWHEAPERNRVLYDILRIDQESEEDVYAALGAYYGMIQFIDDELGRIMEALERLQLRDDTIVVFCSDHGDFAGEHGMIDKGGVFYDCLTRVPLIVSWPGHVPQGVRETSPVSLLDIVPTVLELQGLKLSAPMDGQLLPGVTAAEPRSCVYAVYGAGGPAYTLAQLHEEESCTGMPALNRSLKEREAEGQRRMIRTEKWKLVHDPMGDQDELYDLEEDPGELTNVAARPANAHIVQRLRSELTAWSHRAERTQEENKAIQGGHDQ
ncbi:sulfatase-like hydrolase/transferase [Paenibacillus sp. F411]|uniref:sulfatase family protein n=1 Tax=Paenibacillus sp. F411 TaxID=2820239 RepID=UPI001AAFFB12|nr:sulfatase-like hydrolase/transferase [Paenibacillus sp. F411]MBO2944388.1 sulfatase-like hydrolase/transferase [Paenibacillus sp. F411]